ncbi:MAG: hypothetical protein NTU43_00205 [Bacteroidetes bacterium]|nr:hypothetical protein [Bacteroidota bacterium]
MKAFFQKSFIPLFLLFLVGIFFINIKSTHDWGDDFAQYLHQAKNIVKGIPQSQTGYIINPDYSLLGPPAYTMGFPLLLSVVYPFFDGNIVAYNYLMSFFLILYGLVLFAILQTQTRKLFAALAAIMLVYLPYLLNFKMEILSDLPFAILLNLGVLIYLKGNSKSKYFYLFLTLVSASLLLFRSIGIVFPMAVIFALLLEGKLDKQSLFKSVLAIGLSFFMYYMVHFWIFEMPNDFLNSSTDQFSLTQSVDTAIKNLPYYYQSFNDFFSNSNHWMVKMGISLALLFCCVGMGIEIKKRHYLLPLLVLLYLGVLLVYPYQGGGTRFLIPIMGIVLYFQLLSLKWMMAKFKWNPYFIVVPSLVIYCYMNLEQWTVIYKNRNNEIFGPQNKASVEAFNYIKLNTVANCNILFAKPRALSLYTSRNGFSNNKSASLNEIESNISKYHLDYILINEWLSDKAIKKFVASERPLLVWHTEEYSLYKLDKLNQ